MSIHSTSEHHTEGLAPIQGEFWLGGGIAPGLELKDVLPRFTDEAIADFAAEKPEMAAKLKAELARIQMAARTRR